MSRPRCSGRGQCSASASTIASTQQPTISRAVSWAPAPGSRVIPVASALAERHITLAVDGPAPAPPGDRRAVGEPHLRPAEPRRAPQRRLERTLALGDVAEACGDVAGGIGHHDRAGPYPDRDRAARRRCDDLASAADMLPRPRLD